MCCPAPPTRFWQAARGFWTRRSGSHAWFWTIGLVVIVVLQVSVQYLINVWNRSIFDALEQKNSAEVLYQATIFFPLALASIVLAVAIVFARMTTQRRWRAYRRERLEAYDRQRDRPDLDTTSRMSPCSST